MSSKQEKIQKLLEMQRKFIELEQTGELTAESYWLPEKGSELEGFKDEYSKIAMNVVDDAHDEVGSKR
ncbi:MAG: hypothetical protein OXC42_08090 [Gammaproteobacteria bacterium]|nr:hypothetical protein [Gammaproteobacteria bacterium]